MAPRSMVVFAPISTSSPICTAAHLRHLHPCPRIGRKSEAVGADHRPGVQDTALPDARSGVQVTRAIR